MSFMSTEVQPSVEKALWEDPRLVVERNLVARAQGIGPNNGPSLDFNNDSAPLGALSTSGGSCP